MAGDMNEREREIRMAWLAHLLEILPETNTTKDNEYEALLRGFEWGARWGVRAAREGFQRIDEELRGDFYWQYADDFYAMFAELGA